MEFGVELLAQDHSGHDKFGVRLLAVHALGRNHLDAEEARAEPIRERRLSDFLAIDFHDGAFEGLAVEHCVHRGSPEEPPDSHIDGDERDDRPQGAFQKSHDCLQNRYERLCDQVEVCTVAISTFHIGLLSADLCEIYFYRFYKVGRMYSLRRENTRL